MSRDCRATPEEISNKLISEMKRILDIDVFVIEVDSFMRFSLISRKRQP